MVTNGNEKILFTLSFLIRINLCGSGLASLPLALPFCIPLCAHAVALVTSCHSIFSCHDDRIGNCIFSLYHGIDHWFFLCAMTLTTALHVMLWHWQQLCTSCHSISLCATALHIVSWCGCNAHCAMVFLFVSWHFLHVVALLYMLWYWA